MCYVLVKNICLTRNYFIPFYIALLAGTPFRQQESRCQLEVGP